MKNLIPHFIHDQWQREGRSRGVFEAYTMFIDLSGFTPLTDDLMRKGPSGAEQMSEILNDIFAPLVELVYARGGFIPYFAGDAFTAIFQMEDPQITAKHFLETAIAVRNLFTRREFKFGDFTIGLKIGLSCGAVEWGIVGDQHKSYYFRGRPIDSCADCQTRANNQDIILDEVLRRHLKGLNVKLSAISEVCHRLEEDLPVDDMEVNPITLPSLSKDTVVQFLPAAVTEYNQEGEFRTVIAVFISFEGVSDHEMLNSFATVVLEQINSFSGYFKEIDYGDKGGVMVGFFGAPVSFENNMERALEFIHAVSEELREKKQDERARFRAGITIGTAYTGIVGGRERCQYAAVGNRVNLAARLMTYADWGEILVDAEMHKHRSFVFSHYGDIEYKGIKGSVPTFKYIGRSTGMRSPHTGRMVGRSREIERLWEFGQPILSRQAAGISFIYGEAGVGKSRLTYELKNLMAQEGGIGWHVCQADQILRKPFNPFVYFLKNFFQQTPEEDSQANLNRFETRFEQLLEMVNSVGTPPAQAAAKELTRTKSVLAALIGITYQDSLWEQLDAKGRYQNTLQAVINLLEAGSIIEPLVIEIEDAHWMDENSEELLQELMRHLNRFPIFIVITSRYRDDGTKPTVLERSLLESYNIEWLEVDLNTLQPEAVREMAETNLNGKIDDEFYELLMRTTNSNPFYLEQLLEYFTERNLLFFEDGRWNIKDKDIHLSSSMNAILTARIDRLSILVRETVKAAAVIGREFEVPILTEVMKKHEGFNQRNGVASAILEEQIRQAESGQIWLAMNELRYIFRHSLLREAAYSMQLRARLQQVHLLIAEAVERIYADKLEERYVDLAFHYEQADVFDKTCEYLRKAADHARRNYQNHQALDFYERLLEKLSRQKGTSDQIRTHLKRGRILEMIGQWDECEKAYKMALKLAKKARDVVLLGNANNNYGRLLMLKGNYPAARNHLQTAVQLFESIEDRNGIAKVFGNLGNLYFRQGNYDEAKSYFKESISMEQEDGSSAVNAQIAANLGLTYMNQGDYDEGIRYQKDQLKYFKQKNDKQGMATLYTFMGIVYLEKGDYDEALDSFQQGLKFSEELGNKLLTSIAIGQIGLVYERKGDYQQAMKHYQQDLELCEELGDKQGTAIALGLIGQLLNVQGEFHRAIEYLQKDLMLSEELGYQKGIAKAVNTLGDVFFLTKEYDRSLHFYNRAIDVTRSIGNKLVLGFSLVEKAYVLVELGRMEELVPVYREALELAKELGNPDLLFEAELLSAKACYLEGDIDRANEKLKDLTAKAVSEDQQAAVYYELALMYPSNQAYREKALSNYQRLYDATPRFVFRQRIQLLKDLGE